MYISVKRDGTCKIKKLTINDGSAVRVMGIIYTRGRYRASRSSLIWFFPNRELAVVLPQSIKYPTVRDSLSVNVRSVAWGRCQIFKCTKYIYVVTTGVRMLSEWCVHKERSEKTQYYSRRLILRFYYWLYFIYISYSLNYRICHSRHYATVTWLEYCRYGLKPKTINQSDSHVAIFLSCDFK